jgi:putative aldouronate transport system permease protein
MLAKQHAKPVDVYKKKITLAIINKQKILIFMSFPFLVWLIIFAYVPLWGWVMAFQNYKPVKGILGSPWAGLEHFLRLFTDMQFTEALRNTVWQSAYMLVIGFTMPIIFALLLNEVKHLRFKKVTQTVSYLPHFVSWVIVASILGVVLNTQGIINTLLLNIGWIDRPISFLGEPNMFWPLLAIADTWKSVGWNAIIYIAAITSIDQTLYEAASVDGAGRWRKMAHITLPGLLSVIAVLLILNIGNILNIGFERQILLGNPINLSHSRTIDQYALQYGISKARFSYGTAIGIFRSLISLALLFAANWFARRVNADVGVY